MMTLAWLGGQSLTTPSLIHLCHTDKPLSSCFGFFAPPLFTLSPTQARLKTRDQATADLPLSIEGHWKCSASEISKGLGKMSAKSPALQSGSYRLPFVLPSPRSSYSFCLGPSHGYIYLWFIDDNRSRAICNQTLNKDILSLRGSDNAPFSNFCVVGNLENEW